MDCDDGIGGERRSRSRSRSRRRSLASASALSAPTAGASSSSSSSTAKLISLRVRTLSGDLVADLTSLDPSEPVRCVLTRLRARVESEGTSSSAAATQAASSSSAYPHASTFSSSSSSSSSRLPPTAYCRQRLVFGGTVLNERRSLAENGLDGATEDSLVYLVRSREGLQSLTLTGNHLETVGVEAFARDLPSETMLTEVRLSDCVLRGQAGGEAVAAIAGKAVNLEKLDLGCNEGLGPEGVQALAKNLPKNNGLQSIDVRSCGLHGLSGARATASLACSSPNLEQLNISENNLGPTCVQTLAKGLPHSHVLKKVWLVLCGLRGAAAGRAVGAVVRKAAALEKFDISENCFGLEGIRSFVKTLEPNNSLKELCLMDCGLSGANAGKVIAEVALKLKGLQVLDLSQNLLGAAGLQSLAQAWPEKSSLTELHLVCCRLQGVTGGRALGALTRKATKLSKLCLCDNDRLGAAGIDAVLQKLPKTNVLQDVDLTCCGLWGPEAGRALSELASRATTASLEKLILQDQCLRYTGLKAFARGLPSANCVLKEVCLIDCLLEGPTGGRALGALARKCLHLERLGCGDNELQACGITALAQGLPADTKLLEIGLQNCYLRGAAGGKALGGLMRKATALKVLAIDGNYDLGCLGLETFVAQLASPSSLKEVGIADCGIGGVEGGRAVAELIRKASASLEILHLCGVADHEAFDGAGIGLARTLASELPKDIAMKDLNLQEQRFAGPDGGLNLATIFHKAPKLETLRIALSDLGERGVDTFVEALPETKSLKTLELYEDLLRGAAGGSAAARLVAGLS